MKWNKKKGSEALHRPDMKDFLRKKNLITIYNQHKNDLENDNNCLNDLNINSSIS